MWFGVAPAAAPSSPRPSTQTWRKTQRSSTNPRHRDAAVDTPHLPRLLQTDAQTSTEAAARLAPKENQLQDDTTTAVRYKAASGMTGPTSPRTSRTRSLPVSLMARRQPQQELQHAVKPGPPAASRRALPAARKTATADGKNVAHTLVGPQFPQQQLEDLHASNNNDVSNAGDDAAYTASAAAPAIDRTSLHSAQRVSRSAERDQPIATRPPTAHSDTNRRHRLEFVDALPAPPTSRRSSRMSYQTNLHSPDAFDDNEQQSQSHSRPSSQLETTTASDRAAPPFRSFAAPKQPVNLVGHTSGVCAVAAHDDRFLVSCSVDGSVKIWSRSLSVATMSQCLFTLYGHRDSVSCVDLHAWWLVSGSHDTTLRVYSCVDAFALQHVLEGHTAHVTSVQLVATQPQLIVSGADDATMRVWRADVGCCLFVLRSHASRITCVVAVVDGANPTQLRLCSGGADAAICFWDVPLTLTADTASSLSSPECVDVRALRTFRVHAATVQTLVVTHRASSDASQFVISGSTDGSIQLFNAASAQHMRCLARVDSPIYSLCVVAASNAFVASTGDGRLLHFRNVQRFTTGGVEPTASPLARTWISKLNVCGDVLVCCADDMLLIVDATPALNVRARIHSLHGFVTSVQWLDAHTLVSAGQDNVLKLWRVA